MTIIDSTNNRDSVKSKTKLTPLKMAIIYHSNYGHTQKVAQAVQQGACDHIKTISGDTKHDHESRAIEVKVIDINEMDWDYADAAQMIVFGSAVYMGSVPAEFKTFMDSTSQRWFHREWKGKWAAGFANSGGLSGDKLAVLQQLCIFSMQHGMNWAGFPITPTGYSEEDVNRLSSFMGLMTQSADAPPEETPCQGDIKTAELFGKHLLQLLIDQPPK